MPSDLELVASAVHGPGTRVIRVPSYALIGFGSFIMRWVAVVMLIGFLASIPLSFMAAYRCAVATQDVQDKSALLLASQQRLRPDASTAEQQEIQRQQNELLVAQGIQGQSGIWLMVELLISAALLVATATLFLMSGIGLAVRDIAKNTFCIRGG